MTDLAALRRANEARWAKAKPIRAAEFAAVARRLVAPAAKARYRAVEARTGVPWFFVAVVHQREASQGWSASLAQGDPWNKVSTRVPAGRGPFASWEDAAVDALANCAPYAARNQDWSAGGLLTMLEQYNGLGYAAKGVPSPYVWSGTDQYAAGKYVADHVYDRTAVDKQLGCAGLLMAMRQFDPSVAIIGTPAAKPAVISKPRPPLAAPKPAASPAAGLWRRFVAVLVTALGRRT